MGDNDDEMIGEFTRGQGAIAAALAGLVFVAFLIFDYDQVASGALVSTVAMLSAVWIFRPLWRKSWFWIAIGCITIAHVAAIVLLPWPFENGTRLAPIMVLDVIAVLAAVTLLAKLMRSVSSRNDH